MLRPLSQVSSTAHGSIVHNLHDRGEACQLIVLALPEGEGMPALPTMVAKLRL